MSDKGYLSNRIENAIAKFMDDVVDFKDKRILFGLIQLEKKDRKAFKTIIELIDDKFIGKNPNESVKKEIDTIILFIEKRDAQGFIDHVAGILAGKIDIPYVTFEKQLFLGLLMAASGATGMIFEKVQKLIAEANAEA